MQVSESSGSVFNVHSWPNGDGRQDDRSTPDLQLLSWMKERPESTDLERPHIDIETPNFKT